MRKKIIVIILILLTTVPLFSQKEKFLYCGGMLMFQPGYSLANNPVQKIQEFGYGIGGILRFYPFDKFTIGIMGGSQKTKYKSLNSENSFFTLGYGGPFLGFTTHNDKIRFCFLVGFAKGKIKNLHIQSQNGDILTEAYLYLYKADVLYPIISLDYFITKKIVATSQLIFITAKYNQNDLYFCPVFQLGILFNR